MCFKFKAFVLTTDQQQLASLCDLQQLFLSQKFPKIPLSQSETTQLILISHLSCINIIKLNKVRCLWILSSISNLRILLVSKKFSFYILECNVFKCVRIGPLELKFFISPRTALAQQRLLKLLVNTQPFFQYSPGACISKQEKDK